MTKTSNIEKKMMKEDCIPKTIHYCWFGKGPLPELAQKCINSWKKYCPDYKIVEWNEDNFDLEINEYVKEAYKAKKWAFVSDVARLYALTYYGGIYMDTDVEVIKSLNDLLGYEAVAGFETKNQVSTGLMACKKGQKTYCECLDGYENIHFIRSDGSMDLTTNVTRMTNLYTKYGLKKNNLKQCINGITIFPKDFFSPKDLETKEITITDNTYVIHHFDGSWHSEEDRYVDKLTKKIKVPGGSYLAKIIGVIKYRGIKSAIIESIGWIKRVS
ncbi:glycosyltransferase family 32 protein [uncultured Eubacterium sp.]|uniref:glycosyltransferase family 32 protein n=1 Tax=uncultured Eubacterium sp. TaxID=165185 RepID=UPI0025E32696|nr:glycosyltransferase [uncultured Eubacterium sp.]